MRSSIFVVLLAVAIAFGAGCTGYGKYMITSEALPPTNENDVRVYAITKPGGNYTTLGYLSVYTSNAQDGGDELKRKLKEEAALIGADAIIAFKLNQESGGGGGAEGIAIKFKK